MKLSTRIRVAIKGGNIYSYNIEPKCIELPLAVMQSILREALALERQNAKLTANLSAADIATKFLREQVFELRRVRKAEGK